MMPAPIQPPPYAFSDSVALTALCGREIRRFASVSSQTILAPVIVTILYLIIFSLALGGNQQLVWGIPLLEFLAPGLIMMAIMQNAFANTASSLMIAKFQGNIVDTLMAPLLPFDLILGYVIGGMVRGISVGLAVGLIMSLIVPISLVSPLLLIFHAVMASILMGMLGLVTGVLAMKYDHMIVMQNFIVTPLAFLSGIFYSIDRLPEFWQSAARLNPLFYLINGFRHGFIGRSDSDPILAVVVLCVINIMLAVAVYRLFLSGYRLRG